MFAPTLKRLIIEIHRRSIWQVLLVYVGAAWGCFQIIDSISNRLLLPDWLPGFAIVLFLLALPAVLAAAIVREEDVDAAEPRPAQLQMTTPTLAAPAPGTVTVARRRPITWRHVGFGLIVALAAWGLVAAGWLVIYGPEALAPSKLRSVAVLPFANLSPDPADAYFGDGITDDLITHLARVADLKVISRTSSMRYKDTDKSLREIGDELNVTTILEGGVQRAGDRFRINAQLIDAKTDIHLWSEQYNGRLSDLFAVQSEITREIVAALQAKLTSAERQQLERSPTEDLQAYDTYVQGRFYWNRRTLQDLQRAIVLFEQAIGRDSRYALAYAGLADTWFVLYSWNWAAWDDAMPQARNAVQRALELDPLLGEARTTLATLLDAQYDDAGAEREFVQALALAPGYATGHHWYGRMLARIGRFDEAEVEMRKAAELDPLSRIIQANLGWLRYLARDYAAAIAQLEATTDAEPDFAYAWVLLGEAYAEVKRYPEAITAMRRSFELEPWPNIGVRLAAIYARAGRNSEAIRLVSEHPAADAALVAQVHVASNDADQAFTWLDRALEQRSPYLYGLKVDPRYDSLRGDPRFAELLDRLDWDVSPAAEPESRRSPLVR